MSSMDAGTWELLKKDPAYTGLVGEFQEIEEPKTPRQADAEVFEKISEGNLSATESEAEDTWNKAHSVALMVSMQPTGYETIVDFLSERVKYYRKESMDEGDPDPNLRTKKHFIAQGAKILANEFINYVQESIELAAEKPESLQ